MAGNNLINRNSIIKELVDLNPQLGLNVINKTVEVFFDEIITALVCGDRVELRGFGSWVVRKRTGKVVRNPRTNDRIKVGDKGSLYFRASREFIKLLNDWPNDGAIS